MRDTGSLARARSHAGRHDSFSVFALNLDGSTAASATGCRSKRWISHCCGLRGNAAHDCGLLLGLVEVLGLRDELLEFVKNLAADSDIDGRLVFIVVRKQVWVARQQELEAQPVTVL